MVDKFGDGFGSLHMWLKDGIWVQRLHRTMIQPAFTRLNWTWTTLASRYSRTLNPSNQFKLIRMSEDETKVDKLTLREGVLTTFESEHRNLADWPTDGVRGGSLESLPLLLEVFAPAPASIKSRNTMNRSFCCCSCASICFWRSNSRLTFSRSNCRFVFSLALTLWISSSPWLSSISFSLISSSNSL